MKIFVFQTHGLTEKMTYIHSMDIFLSLFKDKRWFIIFSFLLTFLPSKKLISHQKIISFDKRHKKQ